MDGAGKGYKRFPGYTLAELKEFAAEGVTATRDAARLEMIKQEIRDRESGESKQLKTPQAKWGKDSEERKDASNSKDLAEAQKLLDKATKLQKEAYEETALTPRNQIERRKQLLSEAALLRKEAEKLINGDNRKDEMTTQQRLDAMAEQVNGLGQVAAKVAGRMDVNTPAFINYQGKKYSSTGKTGTRVKNGKQAAEYEEIDKDGKTTGRRIWREIESGEVYPD